jgi:hypothetical protein
MDTTKPAMLPAVKTRMRNKLSWNIGSASLLSITTKAASSTTPPTSRPKTAGLVEFRAREPGRQGLRQLLGPRVAPVPQGLQPGFSYRQDGPPAVLRVGPSLDEAARLQCAERRPHRLRADLLKPGQRGRRGRAAAVEAREGRGLGQREIAFGRRLPQPPPEQADALGEPGPSDVLPSEV